MRVMYTNWKNISAQSKYQGKFYRIGKMKVLLGQPARISNIDPILVSPLSPYPMHIFSHMKPWSLSLPSSVVCPSRFFTHSRSFLISQIFSLFSTLRLFLSSSFLVSIFEIETLVSHSLKPLLLFQFLSLLHSKRLRS